MNIETVAKTFETQTSETLIIGVQKHREQMKTLKISHLVRENQKI